MMCQLKTVRFHGMGRPIIMKGLLPGYGLMEVIFVLNINGLAIMDTDTLYCNYQYENNKQQESRPKHRIYNIM